MKLSSLSRVAMVCVACLLLAREVLAHGVTLKVQHALPAESAFHTQFLLPWTKQLEETSHGRFRFHLTPALSVDPAALLEQVKQGGVDIAYVAIAPSGRFPEFEQFAPPAGTAAEASRALWDHVRAKDLAKKEFNGLRLIAVGASGKDALCVLVMNPAAFKALTDDLKQMINASSGADTSAGLGKAFDAGR
jgi:TRAP-type transport system periplasmic protein